MNIVVWDDLPEGGAKRVVFEQIKGLSVFGRVTYITNQVQSRFDFGKYADKVYRLDMGLRSYRGWLRPLQELSYVTKVIPAYRKAVALIDSLNPDMVLIHPSMITQAPYLLTMMAKPTIYYAHEWPRVVYEPGFHPLPAGFHGIYESVRRWQVGQLDKMAVQAAGTIVTTSTYLQKILSKLYEREISLVPPGVDTNTFCPTERKIDHTYFLFFGGKELISGYPLLQRALATGKSVRLVTLRNSKFRYSDEEIAELYRGAIATLCLAENEPFGLTAIESMACGTPVIAVNSGGYLDTVIANQTGVLVEADSVAVLDAMNKLESDVKQQAVMGRAGRKFAETHFSWLTHVDKLKAIMEQML